MSIHPKYVDAILLGTKQVEFRKRPLAPDISTVIMYATAPVQRVAGAFHIERTVLGSPATIWRRFNTVGGIAKTDFDAYYATSRHAAALVISSVDRYAEDLVLADLSAGLTPPQSFQYLAADVLTDLRNPRGPLLTAMA